MPWRLACSGWRVSRRAVSQAVWSSSRSSASTFRARASTFRARAGSGSRRAALADAGAAEGCSGGGGLRSSRGVGCGSGRRWRRVDVPSPVARRGGCRGGENRAGCCRAHSARRVRAGRSWRCRRGENRRGRIGPAAAERILPAWENRAGCCRAHSARRVRAGRSWRCRRGEAASAVTVGCGRAGEIRGGQR